MNAGTAIAPWKAGLAATKKGWTSDARHRTDFIELHNMFIKRCAREGLSAASIHVYDSNLPKLYTYLQATCGRKHWQQVTKIDIENFVEHYRDLDLSDHTKHQMLRNLKTLLRFIDADEACQKAGMVAPLKALPKIKKLQGRIYLPTPKGLNSFVEAFDQETVWGFRDYVISTLILGCGARIGEICNMQPDDPKWDIGMVRLLGKGNKERIVPVEGDTIFPLLKKWLLVREQYAQGNGEDRMFVGRNGGMCYPNTFDQAFSKHRKRTGLGRDPEGSITPHTLRHFFCTYYLIEGGNIEMLQRITGHEEIQTLMNYVHLANQLGAVKDNHTKVSPLAALKRRVGGEKKKRRMF